MMPLGGRLVKRPRYTLYQYNIDHWAIDCEECNQKVVNLIRNNEHPAYVDIPHVMERLVAHEFWHDEQAPVVY